MDFSLEYYKIFAVIRRKIGLVGMFVSIPGVLFTHLLALMAIFEGQWHGELWTSISIFGFILLGFSQFWVWGRETQGLVAEIEMLRAMKQPEPST